VQPSTTVVFGDRNLDYGLFAAMRFGGGVWLTSRIIRKGNPYRSARYPRLVFARSSSWC